jgi:hypothetical protein
VTHSKGVAGHIEFGNRTPVASSAYRLANRQERNPHISNAPTKRSISTSDEDQGLQQIQTVGNALPQTQGQLGGPQTAKETNKANCVKEVPDEVSEMTYGEPSHLKTMQQSRVGLGESKGFEHPISRPRYLDNFANPVGGKRQ